MKKEYTSEAKKINKKAFPYFIISFWLVGFISFLIYFAYLIRNNSNIDGDIFSYAGGVIGGGMTLLSVIMTMIYNTEIRKKDQKQRDKENKLELAIRYKPFFSNFQPVSYYESDFETIPHSFLDEDDNGNVMNRIELYEYKIHLKSTIKNIGRGEAIINEIKLMPSNITIKNIKIDNIQYEKTVMNNTCLTLQMDISILDVDDIRGYFNYNTYLIQIIYTDLYEQYRYVNETELFIGSINKKGKQNFSCNHDDFVLIAKLN